MSRPNQQIRQNILKNSGHLPTFLNSFFDDEVIEQIIQFRKSYAADKASHQFHVTKEEMRAFLALLLLSGYVSLPRRRMYWEKLPDVNNEAVASTMSRHRFEEILRFLHLADKITCKKKTNSRKSVHLFRY